MNPKTIFKRGKHQAPHLTPSPGCGVPVDGEVPLSLSLASGTWHPAQKKNGGLCRGMTRDPLFQQLPPFNCQSDVMEARRTFGSQQVRVLCTYHCRGGPLSRDSGRVSIFQAETVRGAGAGLQGSATRPSDRPHSYTALANAAGTRRLRTCWLALF